MLRSLSAGGNSAHVVTPRLASRNSHVSLLGPHISLLVAHSSYRRDEHLPMPVLSALRPSRAYLGQLAKSYSSHRPIIQRALTTSFILYVLGTTYRGLSAKQSSSSSRKGKGNKGGKEGDSGKPPRVAVRLHTLELEIQFTHMVSSMQVDGVFYERLSKILRIIIPSLRSKEALLLFMHSSLLIFRTAISLYVAALDGK